jgi:hypothetical protein
MRWPRRRTHARPLGRAHVDLGDVFLALDRRRRLIEVDEAVLRRRRLDDRGRIAIPAEQQAGAGVARRCRRRPHRLRRRRFPRRGSARPPDLARRHRGLQRQARGKLPPAQTGHHRTRSGLLPRARYRRAMWGEAWGGLSPRRARADRGSAQRQARARAKAQRRIRRSPARTRRSCARQPKTLP